MAAAQTINPHTGSLTYTNVGDSVYVLNSRTATYKSIAHNVARMYNGVAIMQCDIWANGGTVAIGHDDVFMWCNRGCTPKKVG
jgi:hypothetical protein